MNLKHKVEDLIGKRFGLLVVKSQAPSRKNKRFLVCQCDCGEIKEIALSAVVGRLVKSCGCRNRDPAIKAHNIKHGGYRTPTHNSWSTMKDRVLNPNHKSFADYGGRGITIDPVWMDFSEFLKDMGERPHGTQLDRIDNNLGYNKDNCRWSTPKENSNNRRNSVFLEYDGKNMTLSEWSTVLNIPAARLQYRLKAGWSVEEAFTRDKIIGRKPND